MYSLEQLKIFVTVVETGSFSATGRKLNRAQSGISQAISNLEIAIDQPLFDRNKNTPNLTKSGKTLLPSLIQYCINKLISIKKLSLLLKTTSKT